MLFCISRYLKTTAANIRLITKFRNKEYDMSENKDEKLFAFWMEFFIDATNDDFSGTQFPVSAQFVSASAYIHLFVFLSRSCCLNLVR